MREPKKFVRRQKVIDRGLQFGLPGRLIVVLIANFVLFFLLAVFMPAASALLVGDTVLGVKESMARLDQLWLVVLLPMAACVLCLAGQGVAEMFKIAGPAYRIRCVAADLAQGRVASSVRVRSKDYLKPTVDSLSGALTRLHGDFSILQEQVAEAEAAQKKGASDRLSASLGAIRSVVDAYDLADAAPSTQPSQPVEPENELVEV